MITSADLFPPLRQLALRPRDVKRLEPHLASSGRLNEVLVLDTISTEDLQRMLLIEANADRPRPRYVIVRKLVARIVARERDRMVTAAYGTGTPSR
jgi:hypothetical protein